MLLHALTEDGKKIFPKLKNFPGFCLAGGTALALQIGHRISVDFDLFSPEPISNGLLSRVEKVFEDSKIEASVNNSDELTVFIDGIKITFLHYPFPMVDKFVEYRRINILPAEEIAATKAYTVGRRGAYKDYVDLYFLLSEGYIGLKELLDLAEDKYDKKFNTRLFLEQLVYLDDVEEAEILFLGNRVGREELKKYFAGEIKKLDLF